MADDRLSGWRSSWSLLLAAGAGLIGACTALSRLDNLVEAPRTFLVLFGAAFVCYGVALWALSRVSGGPTLPLILAVAAACRLVLLPAPPTLSTDAYRYVWDARVATAGVSPYAAAATAPELAGLRDDVIFRRLNHATWRTIYPPGAQLVFRVVYALAPDSVMAMKTAIALAELAALAALVSLLHALGLPLTRVAVYAWNPLVLVEIWGSGHLDGLVVLAVIGALRLQVGGRRTAAAAVLGLGTLVKVYPVILLPLFLQRTRVAPVVAFALVIALGYIPLAHLGLGALGSLPQYATREFFNPGIVRTVIDVPAVTLTGLAAWVVLAAVWRRQAPLVDRARIMVTGFVLLSANVFPWYVVWLVPFLALRPSVPWIAFTGTVGLAYTFFLHEPWTIPAWARVVEIVPAVVAAGLLSLNGAGATRIERSRWLMSRSARGGPS